MYLKVASGPKLKINAHAGMVIMPPPPGDPHFLRIVVQNVGTAPTTITNYTLHSFNGLLSRFRNNRTKNAVVTQYIGKQCPTKLDVGEEVSIMVEQDSRFEEWLKEGVWVGVSHSFEHRPQMTKILDGRRGVEIVHH